MRSSRIVDGYSNRQDADWEKVLRHVYHSLPFGMRLIVSSFICGSRYSLEVHGSSPFTAACWSCCILRPKTQKYLLE